MGGIAQPRTASLTSTSRPLLYFFMTPNPAVVPTSTPPGGRAPARMENPRVMFAALDAGSPRMRDLDPVAPAFAGGGGGAEEAADLPGASAR